MHGGPTGDGGPGGAGSRAYDTQLPLLVFCAQLAPCQQPWLSGSVVSHCHSIHEASRQHAAAHSSCDAAGEGCLQSGEGGGGVDHSMVSSESQYVVGGQAGATPLCRRRPLARGAGAHRRGGNDVAAMEAAQFSLLSHVITHSP